LNKKKAQKNAKKNITSEIINKAIPIRNPISTALVCWPSKVPSRITSLHQIHIIKIISNNPRFIRNKPPWYEWNHITPPVVVANAPVAAIKGQGLGSTKWNGCWFAFTFIEIFIVENDKTIFEILLFKNVIK